MDAAGWRTAQAHAYKTSCTGERSCGAVMKRSSAARGDEKRLMNRTIGPAQFPRPFTRGRFFRPRFYYRSRDDSFARRAGFGLRLHRSPRAPVLWSAVRSRSPSVRLKHPAAQHAAVPSRQASENKLEKSTPTVVSQKKKSASPDRSRSSSMGSVQRPLLSFTVKQEEHFCSSKEALSSVTRAAARNRAIQKKREEIEEVYRRDCDTFGVVVKMLVAKDPSLETPIQTSLRENLRDIGLRCVDAMRQFIQDYDSREPATTALRPGDGGRLSEKRRSPLSLR
ncbi:periphilin-1 isoform X2 [Electrophorus electricus]|uniref:periphilin-1 isoform X2 n=1 Tax=Electrophorus electricus TaxID=8005 RepID=UPI0015D0B61E|nr:periphilin-1 isoform X2 [Electrophorus electricus]